MASPLALLTGQEMAAASQPGTDSRGQQPGSAAAATSGFQQRGAVVPGPPVDALSELPGSQNLCLVWLKWAPLPNARIWVGVTEKTKAAKPPCW